MLVLFSQVTCSGDPSKPVTVPPAPPPPIINADVPQIPPPFQVLVGAGDIARCDNTRDEQTAALMDTIPGTVFTVGDNVQESGTPTTVDFNTCYNPSWGRHKARTRPALGHREGFSTGSATYYDYFGAAAGERGKGYYSYDLGDWHVIVLNSAQSLSAGSAQELWLKADLAASPKQCTVAIWHVPLFTSTASQYNVAVKPAWDDLYAAGAELVINAHAEVYERFMMQTPAGVVDTDVGLRQITVGTGGIGVNGFATIWANSAVRSSGTYGVLKLTLGAGQYRWDFIPVPGQTFRDSGVGTCHGSSTANHPPVANPGGPYTSEGTVNFNGSGSSDPDNQAITYAWNFGDNTTGTGVSPTHTYAADGAYNVSLTVTDVLGMPSTAATTTATIGNLPPVVSAGQDVTVFPAQMYALNVTWSDPGANDAPWNYTINWGDGVTESGTKNDQSAITGSHGYGTPGTYTVHVTVTDKDGATGSDDVVVTSSTSAVLVGAANIAAAYGYDTATARLIDAIPGQVITLGDNAFPDGSITDYQSWYDPTWGRNKLRTRPVVGNHEYQTPNGAGYYQYWGNAAGDVGKGWYTYTLGAWRIIVLNDQVPFDVGSEQYTWLGSVLSSMTEQCTIAMWHIPLMLSSNTSNPPYIDNPTRKILWDRLYEAGVDVILNGHQHHYERFRPATNTEQADDATGIRQFNVGTGGESMAPMPTVIHPLSQVRGTTYGVLKMTLNATDYSWQFIPIAGQTFSDSGTGTCHDKPNVANALPIAQAGGPYSSEAAIAFDGSASSDPDNNLPLSYSWNFGDGTTGTGATPSHTYAANGTYTATLTVTDARGGVSSPSNATVTIANVPPTVNAGTGGSIPVGAVFAESASFSDPNPADFPWSYTIQWGDGSSESGTRNDFSPITGGHAYGAEGSYTIRVSVTDKDGGTGTSTRAITATAPIILAAGDIGDCARTGDEQTAALLDNQVGVVLPLGDNAYLDGTIDEYTNCFAPNWGRHKSRMRPTSGNHDYNTPGGAGYYAYFGAAAGDPSQGYYSYSLGSWFILSLNSQIDMFVGSPEEQWLRQQLASHPNQCVLAYWHYPRWSTVSGRGTLDAVKPLWNALYEYGADIILNGHDHAYQRWLPQTPDGVVDNTYGIPQFAVGTGGGEGLYQFGPTAPNLAVRDNATFGVIKFTLRNGGYDWQFLPAGTGTFTDSGSGTCHSAPPGANLNPVANPGGPYTGENAVTFNGAGSSDPDNNLPLTYAWDFGDGSTGSGVSPSHTYATQGTYTVGLQVFDSKGAGSAVVTTTATIQNQAPVVNAGADQAAAPGQAVGLNATFTDAGGAGDAPFNYTIDWGDGNTQNGTLNSIAPITGSHTYAALGSFTLRVTVMDKDGGSGFDEATVSITDVQVLVGAGDIARCDATRDEATAAIIDTIPGTVFTAGDNVMEVNNQPPDFINCYDPSWGRFKARTRPAIGHREGFSPGSATYYDYFGAAAGERGKGYYSYDLGAWHVIVLNTALSTAVGSAQELWLKADLAASTKQCTVAIWHVPLFTSTVGVNSQIKPLWDDLYAANAELVINAHSEVYERFAPQTPTQVADPVRGIRQITVGTGGISRNTFGTIMPNSEVRNSGVYGVIKLTLTSTGYSWKFIPIPGYTFTDSGSGTCH